MNEEIKSPNEPQAETVPTGGTANPTADPNDGNTNSSTTNSIIAPITTITTNAVTNSNLANPKYEPQRTKNGTFAKGSSGNPGGDGGRARRDLNAATIKEMHRAFNLYGRKAIERTIRDTPATFLKLLVFLVPREMEVTHSGGVKSMTDDQLEAGIAYIKEMLAQREAGANARIVEGVAESPTALVEPPKRKRGRPRKVVDVVADMGKDRNTPNT